MAALTGLLLVAIAGPLPALAATGPIIIPPVTTGPFTYGALSAKWWQYVMGRPTTNNPLLDSTGENCAVGQSGPVFFLVGTWGTSSPVDRTQCTVPALIPLFFPLVNFVDVHIPGLDTNNTPQLIWNDLLNSESPVTSLWASVDGVQIGNLDPATTPYRACAGPASRCTASAFSLSWPAQNLWSVFGYKIPAGTYSPAVADGYYLLLAPLSPGTHTVKFGGTGQDITYALTVK